ncbi:MAG: DsrE family protein [Chloroflexota bacterium]
MKLGVVVYSGDVETVWNAFRFANFARALGDEVNVFMLGKGVEFELLDLGKFNVTEQWQTFTGNGGKIYACGTCLEIHGLKPSSAYTVATLNNLYDIVKTSDRVVTF